jgi:hypothetical protein
MNNVTQAQPQTSRSQRQFATLNRNTAGQAHRIDAFLKLILSLMIGLIMTALTPLAANAAERQYYAFEFDLRKDNQHAVVLEFWYGNSKSDSWVNLPDEYVKLGKTLSSEGVTQMMPPGGLLYVKWRDTETQKVYEDNVDLRHCLPKNIEDHRVYLMFKGPQLYVYLISPEGKKRPPNEIPNGPSMYSDLKIMTIYPSKTK